MWVRVAVARVAVWVRVAVWGPAGGGRWSGSGSESDSAQARKWLQAAQNVAPSSFGRPQFSHLIMAFRCFPSPQKSVLSTIITDRRVMILGSGTEGEVAAIDVCEAWRAEPGRIRVLPVLRCLPRLGPEGPRRTETERRGPSTPQPAQSPAPPTVQPGPQPVAHTAAQPAAGTGPAGYPPQPVVTIPAGHTACRPAATRTMRAAGSAAGAACPAPRHADRPCRAPREQQSWWQRFRDPTDRRARREYRRSLPPLYRWRRVLIGLLVIACAAASCS